MCRARYALIGRNQSCDVGKEVCTDAKKKKKKKDNYLLTEVTSLFRGVESTDIYVEM